MPIPVRRVPRRRLPLPRSAHVLIAGAVLDKVRVLVVHNHYRQRGGEDVVVRAETALLRDRGHEVFQYEPRNARIQESGALRLATGAVWNHAAYRELGALIEKCRPSVIHVHNTLPLISPAVFHVARARKVPVVHTLHNYRLVCAKGTLFRDAEVCEECCHKIVPWPAVVHRCYRSHLGASVAAALTIGVHRLMRTFLEKVDVFIALTEFSRRKFLELGVPAHRIRVKPNFVHPDPGPGERSGGYGLFVGRLSPEKGIDTLLAALRCLERRPNLIVVGDGPLRKAVIEATKEIPGLSWYGEATTEEVYRLMGDAMFAVCPFESYETFGLVAVEAFARGVPVIASAGGAVGELVDDGRTGIFYRRRDARDLARQVEWAIEHPVELSAMGSAARLEFERRYTAERNYSLLIDIYQEAMGFGKRA